MQYTRYIARRIGLFFFSSLLGGTQMGALDLEKRDDQGLCVAQRWWPRIVTTVFQCFSCFPGDRTIFFPKLFGLEFTCITYLKRWTKPLLVPSSYSQASTEFYCNFGQKWWEVGVFVSTREFKSCYGSVSVYVRIFLPRSVFIWCFQKCSCCNAITIPHNFLQNIRLFTNPFKKNNLFEPAHLGCHNTRTSPWSIKTGTQWIST